MDVIAGPRRKISIAHCPNVNSAAVAIPPIQTSCQAICSAGSILNMSVNSTAITRGDPMMSITIIKTCGSDIALLINVPAAAITTFRTKAAIRRNPVPMTSKKRRVGF